MYVPIPFFALASPFWARYFTKDGLCGECVFSRRPTSEEHGQRGFRLSSLGILLARELQSDPAAQGDSSQNVWAPAQRFFELRKARLADLGGAGAWHRWSEELDFFDIDDGGDGYEVSPAFATLRRVSNQFIRDTTHSTI